MHRSLSIEADDDVCAMQVAGCEISIAERLLAVRLTVERITESVTP